MTICPIALAVGCEKCNLNKTMGYEIVLIAHFVYVLAMYSTAVKEYQSLSNNL